MDWRSLHLLFNSLGLEFTEADCQRSGESGSAMPSGTPEMMANSPKRIPYPSGPVSLDSPLYIPRPPIEERAFYEITQPGNVMRIKAPAGFGRTSLLLRIIAQAKSLGYAIASVDLKQADPAILADAGAFLRWFCQIVCLKLDKPTNLDDYWNDILGNSLSATILIREHILESISTPVLLNVQEMNQLFSYPATAQAFFPLLR